MDKLVAMEILLPCHQTNCAITLLCESILSSSFAHMLLGTKHMTGVPGCYGGIVTMTTNDCSITQQYGSILTSYLMHLFLGTKCIIGLDCYYRNSVPDMFLVIIHIFNFTFVLWKHSHTSKSNVYFWGQFPSENYF